MPPLDVRIDDLYKRAPGGFVVARNALAKSLTKEDARTVKALKKPALVAWAANQLYWRARPVYDRLLKSGAELRTAQIAGLKGRRVDLRARIDAHRRALAEAAQRAEQFAAGSGSRLGPDVLAQMLEALSLAAAPPERPGRFTTLLKPAGFEALAGVPVRSGAGRQHDDAHARLAAPVDHDRSLRQRTREAQRSAAAVRRAEAAVERASRAEAHARAHWEKTQADLQQAHERLSAARHS